MKEIKGYNGHMKNALGNVKVRLQIYISLKWISVSKHTIVKSAK